MKDRIQGFLNFLATEKGYAENTIAAYQNDLGQFFLHIQKKTDEKAEIWAQVKKSVIIDYIERIKGGDYTSSTVARKVAAIKSFFHFLVAEGDLKEDPTLTLDSPKVKKRLPKAISLGEIDQLLQAPSGQNGPKAERDLALLEMLYASGMRVTELVSLNVPDIDVDGNTGKIRVKGKKSNSKAREIPITGAALNVLKTYLKHGREQLVHDPNEMAVFLNNRGQRLTRQGLWLIIKHYVETVGISAEVTPHTLRHSFAAHKLSQGRSLQDIQKLLGHANISTTQVYAHLTQESEKEPR
jgi:integrase/recombinase XerD